MPISVDDYRILQAGLGFAQDQVEEAERLLGDVQPRTSDLAGQIARLKEIRRRIEDEQRTVAARVLTRPAATDCSPKAR
jgi:hypothetical protein